MAASHSLALVLPAAAGLAGIVTSRPSFPISIRPTVRRDGLRRAHARVKSRLRKGGLHSNSGTQIIIQRFWRLIRVYERGFSPAPRGRAATCGWMCTTAVGKAPKRVCADAGFFNYGFFSWAYRSSASCWIIRRRQRRSATLECPFTSRLLERIAQSCDRDAEWQR